MSSPSIEDMAKLCLNSGYYRRNEDSEECIVERRVPNMKLKKLMERNH